MFQGVSGGTPDRCSFSNLVTRTPRHGNLAPYAILTVARLEEYFSKKSGHKITAPLIILHNISYAFQLVTELKKKEEKQDPPHSDRVLLQK